MKTIILIACLAFSTNMLKAQSLTIINNSSSGTYTVSVSGHNCTTCTGCSMQTTNITMAPRTARTFASMVAINTTIGWQRGGPATGAAGCGWDLSKVGIIITARHFCSTIVGSGCGITSLSKPLTCWSPTGYATWSNIGGNVTITIND